MVWFWVLLLFKANLCSSDDNYVEFYTAEMQLHLFLDNIFKIYKRPFYSAEIWLKILPFFPKDYSEFKNIFGDYLAFFTTKHSANLQSNIFCPQS